MMQSSSQERVRTRAQRVASRVSYDGLYEKLKRVLYNDSGLYKIGLVLLTAALMCVVGAAWYPPLRYRCYQTPDRDVLCVESFQTPSREVTSSLRNAARANALRYYVNDASKLENYEVGFLTRIQSLLAVPNYEMCSGENLTFLKTTISPKAAEDAAPRAFEKLKAHFAEDADLAELRKALDAVVARYSDRGVIRSLGDEKLKEEKDDDHNVSETQDGAKTNANVASDSNVAPAVAAVQKTPTNAIIKLKVYGVDQTPDVAKVVNASAVLFGNGYGVNETLSEEIDDLEVVSLIARSVKRDLPDTLTLDRLATLEEQQRAEESVQDFYHTFAKGDVLIRAGQSISRSDYQLLQEEWKVRMDKRTWSQGAKRFFAMWCLISALLFGAYLIFYNKLIHTAEVKKSHSVLECGVFFAVMLAFLGVGRVLQVALDNGGASPELVPLLIFVELLALSSSWEVSLTFGGILAFALALSAGGDLDTFVVFVGLAAVVALTSQNIRTRAQLFGVAVTSTIAAFFLTLIVSYTANDHSLVVTEASFHGLWSFLAGFLSTGFLPIFERAFGVLTPMRLLEYSNPTHPLLNELNRRAPATYSHSIQTAALAEPAAEAIGARSALVRVGAYFHDVGKMLQPENFTENQKGYNRHDELEPRISALVIVAHVKDGVELANRKELPKQIVDLIEQHHGTMLVSFFYKRAVDAARAKGDDEPIPDEGQFRYPGPIPQSKEAGLLMISDAVESASRSMTDWSPRRVENLVHKIVESRIEDGQLRDSGLTLGELAIVEQSLTSTLLASRHTRVSYPGKDETTVKVVVDSKDSPNSELSDASTVLAKSDSSLIRGLSDDVDRENANA